MWCSRREKEFVREREVTSAVHEKKEQHYRSQLNLLNARVRGQFKTYRIILIISEKLFNSDSH